MKKDVSSHLAHLLYEQERVFLPGLGTFITQSQEAKRDPLKGIMLPPSRTLQFNPNLFFDDGSLKRSLISKNRISAKAANRILNDYVENLKKRLALRKEAEIPGVGLLKYDENEQVQLSSSEVNFNPEVYGLPRVQARLLSAPVAEKPAYNPPARTDIPVPSMGPPPVSPWYQNRLWVGIAASAAVVLIVALILFRSGDQQTVFTRNQQPPASVLPPPEVGIPLPPPPERVDRPEQARETPAQNPSPRAGDGPMTAPKEKSFLIMLGTFRDLGTAQRYMARILELGYQTRIEPDENGTRLGFTGSYSSEEEVEEALRLAREEFNSEAVLVKK